MTEAEWLNEENPFRMLECLRDQFDMPMSKAGQRKLRLYACGCCRQIWKLFRDERSRAAVNASEAYADGRMTIEELNRAQDKALWVVRPPPDVFAVRPPDAAAHAALAVSNSVVWQASRETTSFTAESERGDTSRGLPRQAQLIREIFGDPFRPASVNDDWLTWHDAIVVKLAQTIYDDRRFDLTPILADALEEAGCTDEAILTHCREAGAHILGCWVLDLLLGNGLATAPG